jgi:putative transposase
MTPVRAEAVKNIRNAAVYEGGDMMDRSCSDAQFGRLYKNKYRIASTRLQNWDYGSNAAYFVTICTRNRIEFFGGVVDGIMVLSDVGIIAEKYWNEIPEHFPFVTLGVFVVMPNHVHGIIIIDKTNNYADVATTVETPNLDVSTGNTENATGIGITWKPGILGVIINQYKRICTIESRKINPDFAWQSRFYDNIIRNDESYQKISEYIINNPLKWGDDDYYEK